MGALPRPLACRCIVAPHPPPSANDVEDAADDVSAGAVTLPSRGYFAGLSRADRGSWADGDAHPYPLLPAWFYPEPQPTGRNHGGGDVAASSEVPDRGAWAGAAASER